MNQLAVDSPVGSLLLSEDGGAVVRVEWRTGSNGDSSTVLRETAEQLRAYFAGELDNFDLPLAPAGTAHQHKVWQAMQDIPFGNTRSYGDVAAAIGSSPLAVGTACGKNPIPIIIPCHRILAAGSRIGGYSGGSGTDTKRYLLSLEGAAFNT